MDSELDISHIISKSDYFQNYVNNLWSLLQPASYCLNFIVKVLLNGPDGSGKRLLAKVVAKNMNMKFFEERVADLIDDSIVETEKRVRDSIIKYATLTPCIVYMTGFEIFCKLEDSDLDRIEHCIRDSLEELLEPPNNIAQPFVFLAGTNDFDQVDKSQLSSLFHKSITLKSPTFEQAENILQLIHGELDLKSTSESIINRLLTNRKNSEFYIGTLINLIAQSEVDCSYDSKNIDDFTENNDDELDQEETRWLDIGGLNNVKQEIIDSIQLSLDFPQLKKSGLRRTGVLLHGPPGTGKTLLARAVATECNLNFINVKGPELLNEYVGQSEDNVRKLFQRARENSPSVIFFDEIDSLAPNRGQTGDSGSVMDRMVSQILAELDGVGKSDDLFVIGATNRVDLIDPTLLRPGRFDKILEVPLPTSKDNRIQILQALTRKLKLAEDVDIELIESKARANMSGADFQGLCSRALNKAFNRCADELESGRVSENDVEVVTTMIDFLESIKEEEEEEKDDD